MALSHTGVPDKITTTDSVMTKLTCDTIILLKFMYSQTKSLYSTVLRQILNTIKVYVFTWLFLVPNPPTSKSVPLYSAETGHLKSITTTFEQVVSACII